jgi:hypothetical protein
MRIVLAIFTVAALFSFAGIPAFAHERRAVGPYQLVVGFIEEPAYVAATNGVSLRVTDMRNTPPAPVEGLHETLRVEVSYGGLSRSLALDFAAAFGEPGLYAAHFVPTAAGSYIFRIHGNIADLAVDERFESGPGRFDDVEATGELQYPEQVPAGGELTRTIADLRGALDQARVIAAVALLIALAALVLPRVRSRRG